MVNKKHNNISSSKKSNDNAKLSKQSVPNKDVSTRDAPSRDAPNKNMPEKLLTETELAQIKKMFQDSQQDKNMEFEISFRGVDYSNFVRISEKFINAVDKNNISTSTSLDVSVNMVNGDTYRVSMLDTDQIDTFISKYTGARTIDLERYLLSLNPSETIGIMFKDRGSATRLLVNDLDSNFKLTKETELSNKSKKPEFNGTEKILFRYKNRYSFNIAPNLRLDITDVQESNNLHNLQSRSSKYEIELEVTGKTSFDNLMDQYLAVLRIVQNTNIPITKSESQTVIQKYCQLLGINSKHPHLDVRNVISIEKNHIVNFVPNKYAVTDKADGERYCLFVTDEGTYLLSTNLIVKKTNLVITNNKFHNTILDGELIETTDGPIFMAFDVIFSAGVDYRTNDKYNLPHRIEVLNIIIDQCFSNLVPFTDYTDKNNDIELTSILKFLRTELKAYWDRFSKALKKFRSGSDNIFVTRKLYLVPYGIDSCEVFAYADLIWKLYVYDEMTPYTLDGIIYTPINAPYMIKTSAENMDKIPMEYKWKQPKQNSIDFYIRFNKDTDGNELVYYDNSVVRESGNSYKICTLNVGVHTGGQEKPIPFKVNGVEQTANIYLVDGEARDSEGNVINDETVVEFIYDTEHYDISDAFKWIPIRTRYDKTESVRKFGKKYGNNLMIATRIWKTIVNPITEETIATLANPSTYQKEIDRLSKSAKPESYAKQNFVYYQKKTADASGMRAFNNWVKTNLITTYCFPGTTVLDIGCGRGGDIGKFYAVGINEYVGVDIDNNGLYVINDSAYKRYKNMKAHIKDMPPMYFINADARGKFNIKAQESILPTMSQQNKELIATYLSGNKKYDVINCQFTLHYYLSDDLSWSNFCTNVSDHLNTNGYLLVTCFDGKLIYDRLGSKNKITVTYTDNFGNKNTFFEIVKIYNDDSKIKGTGMAIDFYNSLISNPGVYIREYLVFPDFLQKSLKEKCGLDLVETDTFFNLFNLYKNYFTQEQTKIEGISQKKYHEIREFYQSIKPNFYEHSDVESDTAMASFKLAMLNRYYVFKKTSTIDLNARVVGVNNQLRLGKILSPYFLSNRMYIDTDSKTSRINGIYHQIRRENKNIKPSVYLIRHSINDDLVENNKFEFLKAREGTDPKVLLIYKSPERFFYPVYFDPNIKHEVDSRDIQDIESMSRVTNRRRVYLLNSDKIIGELDFVINLSDQIKQIY